MVGVGAIKVGSWVGVGAIKVGSWVGVGEDDIGSLLIWVDVIEGAVIEGAVLGATTVLLKIHPFKKPFWKPVPQAKITDIPNATPTTPKVLFLP